MFASALVGRSDIPLRLRRLLNVESGLNDGLALPFVLIFLAMAKHESSHLGRCCWNWSSAWSSASASPRWSPWPGAARSSPPNRGLQPLGPVAIAVVVYAGCHLTHANPYLAAFAAGSALATLDHVAAEPSSRSATCSPS